jgi:hypothetical protein
MRHYVVPLLLSHTVSQNFKTHLPHDIVLVCIANHHVKAGRKYHKRMQRIEDDLRTDRIPRRNSLTSVHQIRNSATALLKFKDKLPLERIAGMKRYCVNGTDCHNHNRKNSN